MLAVRWCLRYGLSYRGVEELLAERGIDELDENPIVLNFAGKGLAVVE